MPIHWDDDEDEELTELEYQSRSNRVLIHDEITAPMGEPTPRRSSGSTEVFLPSAPMGNLIPGLPFQPAPLRDRFAAFLIDSWIGFLFYWLIGALLLSTLKFPNLSTLHQLQSRFVLHLALSLTVFFFYYLLMESVFCATLGKFFTRLRVVDNNGRRPSLGAIFLRNILRVIDYFPAFLVAVITMESSAYHQRLGDRAASTLVIKKTRRFLPQVQLQHTPVASTLSKIFAELVDLILALTGVYGLVLIMSPRYPLFSMVLYWNLPVAFIAYYTLLEFFFGTTPGKALFGRGVVQLHGEPLDGTSALLRNCLRPLDYFLGYPLMVLSKKKQRLGDMAADTLVVCHTTGKQALWSIISGVFCVFVIAYIGFKHPDNYLKRDYGVGPLQGIKILIPNLFGKLSWMKQGTSSSPKTKASANTTRKDLPQAQSTQLKLQEFYFSTGPVPSQIQNETPFRRGDPIYAFFKIAGFQTQGNQEASFSEDIEVTDPQGQIVFEQTQAIASTKQISNQEVLFANHIKLPKTSPSGKYQVKITVYDHVAQTQYGFEKEFEMQ